MFFRSQNFFEFVHYSIFPNDILKFKNMISSFFFIFFQFFKLFKKLGISSTHRNLSIFIYNHVFDIDRCIAYLVRLFWFKFFEFFLHFCLYWKIFVLISFLFDDSIYCIYFFSHCCLYLLSHTFLIFFQAFSNIAQLHPRYI